MEKSKHFQAFLCTPWSIDCHTALSFSNHGHQPIRVLKGGMGMDDVNKVLCHNCEKQIRDTANYCPFCGNQVKDPIEVIYYDQ